MPFCKNCGMELPEYMEFCTNCGTPVEKFNQPQAEPVQPQYTAHEPVSDTQTEPVQGEYVEQEPVNNTQAEYAGQQQTQTQGSYTAPNYTTPNYSAPNYNAQNYSAPNYTQPQYNPVPEQKSSVAAGLLGIFLGGLGIHNFYLGYTTKALIQLLCTILLCWTFVVPIAMEIWGFIEGILVLTGSISVDGRGVPIKKD